MAAIIEPQRYSASDRPALRLVPVQSSSRSATAVAPVEIGVADLGLRLVHLVAAIALFVVFVGGAIAVSSGALAGLAPAPSASSGAVVGETTVTVEPGDTLWSIARRVQPTGDVRPLVDQLAAARGGEVLQPGQQVVVPG